MDTFYSAEENDDLVRKNHHQLINNVIEIIQSNINKVKSLPGYDEDWGIYDYSGELKDAAFWLFPVISEDGMRAWSIYEDPENNSITFSSTAHGWSFWVYLYKEHGFIKLYSLVKNSEDETLVDEGIDFIDFDKIPTEYLAIKHTVELYREFSKECRGKL